MGESRDPCSNPGPIPAPLCDEVRCQGRICPANIRKKIIKDQKTTNSWNPFKKIGFGKKVEACKLTCSEERNWKQVRKEVKNLDKQLQKIDKKRCLTAKPKVRSVDKMCMTDFVVKLPKATLCLQPHCPVTLKKNIIEQFNEPCTSRAKSTNVDTALHPRNPNNSKNCTRNVNCKLKDKDERYFRECIPNCTKQRYPEAMLTCDDVNNFQELRVTQDDAPLNVISDRGTQNEVRITRDDAPLNVISDRGTQNEVDVPLRSTSTFILQPSNEGSRSSKPKSIHANFSKSRSQSYVKNNIEDNVANQPDNDDEPFNKNYSEMRTSTESIGRQSRNLSQFKIEDENKKKGIKPLRPVLKCLNRTKKCFARKRAKKNF